MSNILTGASDEFIESVGPSLFRCTICWTNKKAPLEPMKLSRVENHVNSKSHATKAAYERMKLLESKQAQGGSKPVPPFIPEPLEQINPPQQHFSFDQRSAFPEPQVATPPPPPDIEYPLPGLGGDNDAYNDLFLSDNVWAAFDHEHHGYTVDPDIFWAPPSADLYDDVLAAEEAFAKGPSRANNPPEIDSSYGPYKSREASSRSTVLVELGVAQQQAILEWAIEMGAPNVPSLYALSKCDEAVKALAGESSRMYRTQSGNIYYLNSIDKMVQQDFSNPHVRIHLEFYPEDADNMSSEVWHGEKLVQGHNRKQLTPMVTYNTKTYFVDEVCELADGSLFVPDMFLQRSGEMWARGNILVQDPFAPHNGAYIKSPERVSKPLSEFWATCLDLRSSYPNGIETRGINSSPVDILQPNPLRAKANGRPIYSVPFIVFVDDVSGNKSKQWNKHWCCYLSNASLPRAQFNRRVNTRFMGTTQHASPLEMLFGVRDNFESAFESMIVAWDCLEQCEVLVRPYVLFIAGDNPMQAEVCSSTGLRSNELCRTCRSGGPQRVRLSDEGYSQLFQVGTIRTACETSSNVSHQFEIAYTATAVNTLTLHQRRTGVKDSIAQPILERIMKRRQDIQKLHPHLPMVDITEQLREEFALVPEDSKMNPLLTMDGLDVHIDTPTEILHTLLLGMAKYLWVQVVNSMDEQKTFDRFATRLQSISVTGLNKDRPMPDYILTNRGSLNGKHFKMLTQTIAFCLSDLVPQQLCTAWFALSRLVVLAWYSVITDLDGYLGELHAAIQLLLHELAVCAPQLLVDKAKTHLLVHMPFFVRRFGPLLGPDTERYESFNSVFRECSILSNRLAPSRDIAAKFATFSCVRHIALGGQWLDPATQMWKTAGPHVIALSKTSRFLTKMLGYGEKPTKAPGSATVHSKAPRLKWSETNLSTFDCPPGISEDTIIQPVTRFIADSGDNVVNGSNVVFHGDQPSPTIELGCVHEIWRAADTRTTHVLVNTYEWLPDDKTYMMPAVRKELTLVLVSATRVLGVVNLQHRCAFLSCSETGTAVVRQERQDSNVTYRVMEHADNINFVVNIHSLHNYELIRQLLAKRFNMCSQFEDSSAYIQIRNNGALHMRQARKIDVTETNLDNPAQGSSQGATQKKRKRKEQSTPSSQQPEPVPSEGGTWTQGAEAQHAPEMVVQWGPWPPPGPAAHIPVPYQPPYPHYLPIGWRAVWSFSHGRFYFHNTFTGVVTWAAPLA